MNIEFSKEELLVIQTRLVEYLGNFAKNLSADEQQEMKNIIEKIEKSGYTQNQQPPSVINTSKGLVYYQKEAERL